MLLYANELTWELFTDLATQVRTAGMGGVTGFDYGSLPVFFDAYEVPDGYRYETVKKLTLISSIAVELWNKDTKVKKKAQERPKTPH